MGQCEPVGPLWSKQHDGTHSAPKLQTPSSTIVYRRFRAKVLELLADSARRRCVLMCLIPVGRCVGEPPAQRARFSSHINICHFCASGRGGAMGFTSALCSAQHRGSGTLPLPEPVSSGSSAHAMRNAQLGHTSALSDAHASCASARAGACVGAISKFWARTTTDCRRFNILL